MSTLEHIYIDTDEPVDVVGERLSRVLGMAIVRNERGEVFLGRSASMGGGEVGGQVYPNHGPDPEASDDESCFLDGFRTVFEVGHTRRDADVQRVEALRLFEELSLTASFGLALVHGFDVLIAVSRPDMGIVMLPAGTTPYAPDRQVWLPYALAGR